MEPKCTQDDKVEQFNSAYAMHNRQITKLVQKYVRQRDTEDVSQQVWSELWSKIIGGGLDQQEDLLGWLLTVTRRLTQKYNSWDKYKSNPIPCADLDAETIRKYGRGLEYCGLTI